MNEKLLDYFKGDELAASVWESKYQLKDEEGNPLEETPDDMHKRLANEFARIETSYFETIGIKEEEALQLSEQGFQLYKNGLSKSEIFNYFKDFKYIIPQGSIMAMLGHPTKTGSLSNCFVVPSPEDSYGGIIKTDEHLAQLMKRRGGVGTNLNNLRPIRTKVSNAAGSSTGVPSFAERYSNTTREVAQDGRRGALMLLLDCRHPDIFKFVSMKQDRTKVTGANISVMFTNEFMEAVKANLDFLCKFPIDLDLKNYNFKEDFPYYKLTDLYKGNYVMKIKARELFELVVEMAWENAEPGVAYIDSVNNYSPDGVYHIINKCNPCGEQWLPDYDSCRLFALNFFSIVENPFTLKAEIDFDLLYEISYIQQRLADDLVDLEIEYIYKIIEKIKKDPESKEIKRTELELWENILKTAESGRRTGCGFTGLGDMLAALNLNYDSNNSLEIIEQVMRCKMEAELDCTIDLAILRGPFESWNPNLEFDDCTKGAFLGKNTFYSYLANYFDEHSKRMCDYGRRNISWSTVAPTGSVSILTQTTSGLEPLFQPFYMRRKKVNPNDKDIKVDFVDQNGDSWTEHAVLHPKFKEWLSQFSDYMDVDNLSNEALKTHFEKSPWYKSTANDISWEKRIEIQSIIQKYTTNAISSTINLPEDVSKEVISNIYMAAYEYGLKGVTVYRDNCRTGVLVNTETNTKEVAFSQKDAAKRPKSLKGEGYLVIVKGIEYIVLVGLLDNKPYEIFASRNKWELPKYFECEIIKKGKGKYDIETSNDLSIKDFSHEVTDEEGIITRLVSTSLRHGTDVMYICEQISKTEGNMVSFGKALYRTLKRYIKEGTKSTKSCNECGSNDIIFEEGCSKCLNCGSSKCG